MPKKCSYVLVRMFFLALPINGDCRNPPKINSSMAGPMPHWQHNYSANRRERISSSNPMEYPIDGLHLFWTCPSRSEASHRWRSINQQKSISIYTHRYGIVKRWTRCPIIICAAQSLVDIFLAWLSKALIPIWLSVRRKTRR